MPDATFEAAKKIAEQLAMERPGDISAPFLTFLLVERNITDIVAARLYLDSVSVASESDTPKDPPIS